MEQSLARGCPDKPSSPRASTPRCPNQGQLRGAAEAHGALRAPLSGPPAAAAGRLTEQVAPGPLGGCSRPGGVWVGLAAVARRAVFFSSSPVFFPLIYPPTLLCPAAFAGSVPRVRPTSARPFCMGISKNRPRATKLASRLARGFQSCARASARLPAVCGRRPRPWGRPRRGGGAGRGRL